MNMFCSLRYNKINNKNIIECEIGINMCCYVCPLKNNCLIFKNNLEKLPCKDTKYDKDRCVFKQ